MLSIDEKITEIIHQFNLNNYAFSKRIGVTGTTIDSIVNGRPQADGSRKKTKPGYDVLLAIINTFDINPDYLFGKSEIMLSSKIKSIPTYSGISHANSKENNNVVFVSIKAKTDYLNNYKDDDYINTLPSFRMPNLASGTHRCFEVQGKAMERTIFDKDLVYCKYVDSISDIKKNEVCVVLSKTNGVVLRRVIYYSESQDKLLLKSDNQNGSYPDFAIDTEDVLEIWKVIMYASKQIPKPINVYDKLNELELKIMNLENKF